VKELAEGVWRLKQFPGPWVNVYLVRDPAGGDVLIDAGGKGDKGRILAQTRDRELSLLALTHVHPDHQGAAKAVCEKRGIPLACHADDVDAMEGRRPVQEAHRKHPVNAFFRMTMEGPPHKVSRVLNEGDEVAGFRVIHAPGHQRGEVIYFRDSDRVAICGDVMRNLSFATGRAKVQEPPEIFTMDPVQNRRSIRKLAGLDPSVILPGHGPELRDRAKFERFVERLPD
jgi:hydroxyacylglutathione hydrolase